MSSLPPLDKVNNIRDELFMWVWVSYILFNQYIVLLCVGHVCSDSRLLVSDSVGSDDDVMFIVFPN